MNRTRVWCDLETAMSTVHNFTAATLEGQEKPLSDFSGQVLLVVKPRCLIANIMPKSVRF